MNARAIYALTAVNIAVVALGIGLQLRSVFAQGEPPVLRGRALQIVDDQGRVRASITIDPAARQADGVHKRASGLSTLDGRVL